MGLFRELGRRVAQFTTKAKTEAEERTAYRCEACGARFDERRERCPECGSEDALSIEEPE